MLPSCVAKSYPQVLDKCQNDALFSLKLQKQNPDGSADDTCMPFQLLQFRVEQQFLSVNLNLKCDKPQKGTGLVYTLFTKIEKTCKGLGIFEDYKIVCVWKWKI